MKTKSFKKQSGDIKLIDLAHLIPNAVSHDVCDTLISYYQDNRDNSFKESSTNTMTLQEEESTFECVYPEHGSKQAELCEELFAKSALAWCDYLYHFNIVDTSELMEMTNRAHHYRIMRYGVGASIHPHTDVGNDLPQSLIRASCTINLSDSSSYEGGLFSLLNDQRMIKLGKGDVLIFPASSFWVHRVTPVESGERYCVNGFLGPNIGPTGGGYED